MCRILKGLNLSLKERVRRKLILAGILPKLSDLARVRWAVFFTEIITLL
jgi:hypothetical protein